LEFSPLILIKKNGKFLSYEEKCAELGQNLAELEQILADLEQNLAEFEQNSDLS